MTTQEQQDAIYWRDECNRRREAGLALRGNTYPLKEHIKLAGGIWDKNLKCWLMPDNKTLEDFRQSMTDNHSTGPINE